MVFYIVPQDPNYPTLYAGSVAHFDALESGGYRLTYRCNGFLYSSYVWDVNGPHMSKNYIVVCPD